MRLEAQAKAGFYPTPAEVVEIIQTWIAEKAPGLRRLLDPCCGTGEPAARIAAAAGRAVATERTDRARAEPRTFVVTTAGGKSEQDRCNTNESGRHGRGP